MGQEEGQRETKEAAETLSMTPCVYNSDERM